MDHEELREQVCQANAALAEAGLVVLAWGTVSGADREAGVLAIKPSGISPGKLRPQDVVVLSIATGEVLEGSARPSADTPAHLHLYREFAGCGGIAHAHSPYATAFAQAGRDIPPLGTTHADHFYGTVPATRPLSDEEINFNYELNMGKVIVECFRQRRLEPRHVPGVLVTGHGPFAWGETPQKAVENAIVLEFAAKLATLSFMVEPSLQGISQALLAKHYLRKHGSKAYYGQH